MCLLQATLAFENQEEGFIAKLLVGQGTKDIPVGKPLAILVEDKASIGAFINFAPGVPPTSATNQAPAASKEATSYPPHTVSKFSI